jgi:hypothetical protein
MFVPQLLEKNQQNLEYPKYHIVNTPTASSGSFWRTEKPTRVCGGGRGVTPPVSISFGIPIQFSRANFENICVSHIEK